MNLTTSQLFDAAYALLDPDDVRLVKGGYGGPDKGGFCAVGALRQAAFGRVFIPVDGGADAWPPYYCAFTRMARYVGSLDLETGESIPSWNDMPERTKADVLALFRRLSAEATGTEVGA